MSNHPITAYIQALEQRLEGWQRDQEGVKNVYELEDIFYELMGIFEQMVGASKRDEARVTRNPTFDVHKRVTGRVRLLERFLYVVHLLETFNIYEIEGLEIDKSTLDDAKDRARRYIRPHLT